MSRQDKTISERHTRTLRELVKRSENKVCADCKRNDPRWASWNLGVFLCIRCSGIHRGMGTHISKVKSVDLDVWTPEQMKSIQLWGNTRANLYWEAHLKPGHIPPDHKMESFIRSKYESRRWALEGPPPEDPSTLENGHEPIYSEPAPPAPQQQQPQPSRVPTVAAQPVQQQRQSQTRLPTQARPKQSAASQTQPASPAPQSTATAQTPAVTSPQDDLFSLDFHAPSTSSSATSSIGSSATAGPKDVKNNILSLFAAAPPPGSGILGGGFGDGSTSLGTAHPQAQAQPTSMLGNSGTGMWGVQSGWSGMQNAQAQQAQAQIWSQPSQTQQQQQPFGGFSSNAQPQSAGLFGSQNVWGGGGSTGATQTGMNLFSTPFSSTTAAQPVKKDDAFGDLWGSFK